MFGQKATEVDRKLKGALFLGPENIGVIGEGWYSGSGMAWASTTSSAILHCRRGITGGRTTSDRETGLYSSGHTSTSWVPDILESILKAWGSRGSGGIWKA